MVSPESSGVEQFKTCSITFRRGRTSARRCSTFSRRLSRRCCLCSFRFYRQSLRLRTRLRASGHTAQWKRFCLRRSACAAFLQVKAASSVLASGLVTAVSFILFFCRHDYRRYGFESAVFFDLSWFVLVFLLSPAITVLGVTFAAMLTVKARSTAESIQISAISCCRFCSSSSGQIMGLYRLNSIAAFDFDSDHRCDRPVFIQLRVPALHSRKAADASAGKKAAKGENQCLLTCTATQDIRMAPRRLRSLYSLLRFAA